MEDAKLAGLTTRSPVWKSYPKRMLQMRARGFALRDQFADALKGLSSAEEVRDYDIKKSSKNITPKEEFIPADEAFTNEDEIKEAEEMLRGCESLDSLAELWKTLPSSVRDNLVLVKDELKERFKEAA